MSSMHAQDKFNTSEWYAYGEETVLHSWLSYTFMIIHINHSLSSQKYILIHQAIKFGFKT